MKALALAAVVCCCVTGGVVAAELEGESLRKTVAGKTVHLDTPLGTLPILYRPDGTMAGKSVQLAYYTGSVQDRGIWWIVRDKLCQKWASWLEGKSYCFSLHQNGNSVQWRRNDGLTGTATIGR